MSEDVIVSTMILYQMCLIMSRVFSDDEAEMKLDMKQDTGWNWILDLGSAFSSFDMDKRPSFTDTTAVPFFSTNPILLAD